MITISIAGYGTYQVSSEKLQELLNWLAQNAGVRTQNNEQTAVSARFTGLDLING